MLLPHIRCRQFLVDGMTRGMTVLDIGCGDGDLMSELIGIGCTVKGVEIDRSLVRACQAKGMPVSEGRAERLPIEDSSVDAIVCSVVLSYTLERQAVEEWARVLKPGGVINATYHGIGYGLNYLFYGPRFKTRVYGFRMLANTLFYRLTSHRLPGFLGDTLCQTSRRMMTYYRTFGLRLEREQVVGVVAGTPRFLCHRVIKPILPK